MKLKAENGVIQAPTLADGWYNVTKYVKKRSNAQNALLHGHILPEASIALSVFSGKKVTQAMSKSLLKMRFLSRFDEKLGDYVIPTSKLTAPQFVKFVEDCVRFLATRCNHYVTLPDDWQRSIMENKL